MSLELINMAIDQGAVLYPNVSGGKDGQAMVKTMMNNGIPIEGLIHADLGRTEWKESIGMCEKLSRETGKPLHVVRRSDGRDMIDHWRHRLNQLKGTGKPFWSSSQSRYCTSDMKRDPIDKFYRNCGHNFIVSCEGIRGGESKPRAKKIPLTIRTRITAPYYKGMTVQEAIAAYNPKHRLALTWYPIFHFSLEDVLATYGMNSAALQVYRDIYKGIGKVMGGWPFHPAYVYGNNRVSCVFCILGCNNDLKVGAKHRPELLNMMIEMEEEGQATFKNNFSLKELLQ